MEPRDSRKMPAHHGNRHTANHVCSFPKHSLARGLGKGKASRRIADPVASTGLGKTGLGTAQGALDFSFVQAHCTQGVCVCACVRAPSTRWLTLRMLG